jgi:hypothetical protein
MVMDPGNNFPRPMRWVPPSLHTLRPGARRCQQEIKKFFKIFFEPKKLHAPSKQPPHQRTAWGKRRMIGSALALDAPHARGRLGGVIPPGDDVGDRDQLDVGGGDVGGARRCHMKNISPARRPCQHVRQKFFKIF